MPVKLIVFDMDGTLLDSMAELETLAKSIIVQYSSTTNNDRAIRCYHETVGLPFVQQLESIWPNRTRNTEFAKKYDDRHWEMAPLLFLSPGVTKSWVEGLGVPAVLVSSTHRSLILSQIKNVQNIGLRHIGGFTEGNTKLHQIMGFMQAFDVKPSDTLFVGDTKHDKWCADYLMTQFLLVQPESVVVRVNHYVRKHGTK